MWFYILFSAASLTNDNLLIHQIALMEQLPQAGSFSR